MQVKLVVRCENVLDVRPRLAYSCGLPAFTEAFGVALCLACVRELCESLAVRTCHLGELPLTLGCRGDLTPDLTAGVAYPRLPEAEPGSVHAGSLARA